MWLIMEAALVAVEIQVGPGSKVLFEYSCGSTHIHMGRSSCWSTCRFRVFSCGLGICVCKIRIWSAAGWLALLGGCTPLFLRHILPDTPAAALLLLQHVLLPACPPPTLPDSPATTAPSAPPHLQYVIGGAMGLSLLCGAGGDNLPLWASVLICGALAYGTLLLEVWGFRMVRPGQGGALVYWVFGFFRGRAYRV